MKSAVEAVRFSGAGLFFLIAVVLAVATGGMIFSYMRSAVETEAVIAVVRDLPPGSQLAETDIEVREVPRGSAPPAAYPVRDKSKAVGQRIRYGLVSGAVIQVRHLVKNGSYVSGQVAEEGSGFRAISIPGDLVPGLERLLSGDILELTGVLSNNSTLVTVPLGTAKVMDLPQQNRDRNEKGQVLILVRTEQVSQLALAMRGGGLVVSVVGHGKEPAPAPTVRLDILTGAVAAKPPAATARP